jgi:hypothetical protein
MAVVCPDLSEPAGLRQWVARMRAGQAGSAKQSIYFVATGFIMRKTTTACKADERKPVPPQDGSSRMQGRDEIQGGLPCNF